MKNLSHIFLLPMLNLILPLVALGEIVSTNYVNNESFPVKITVPYYEGTGTVKKVRPLEITLEPGDAYFPADGCNGVRYIKYGLMPQLALKDLTNSPKNFSHENYASGIRKLKAKENIASLNVMPKSWVNASSNNFIFKIGWYEELIKGEHKRAIDGFLLKTYSFYTNNLSPDYNSLSNPDFDTDRDGLANREECLCDTNPLLPDMFYVKPSILKITKPNSKVATNFFEIVNNTDHDARLFVKLWNHTLRGLPWNPRILNVQSGQVTTGFYDIACCQVAPRGSAKFAYLADSSKLPFIFESSIDCKAQIGIEIPRELMIGSILGTYSPENDDPSPYEYLIPCGEIKLSGIGYDCPEPAKPVVTSPQNCLCYTGLYNLAFSWKDDGGNEDENFKKSCYYDIESYEWDDEYNCWSERSFIKKHKDFSGICEYEYIHDYGMPGVYVWRVRKIAAGGAASYSDWQWFFTGAPVAPADNAKIRIKHEIVRHEVFVGDWDVFFFSACFLDFDRNYSGQYMLKFLEPLPKWVKDDSKYRHGHYPFSLNMEPTPGSEGCYTNHCVLSNGETTLTNLHIFISREARP